MVTYRYIAKTTGGEQVTGTIQADNETAALRTLDDRELYPVRVEPGERPAAAAAARARIRTRDVAIVYGQLSDLLAAGVPMLRALATIIRATPNQHLSRIIGEVHESVSAGRTLAESMGAHPEAFSALHAAMIRAGEQGGFLEDVLGNLAEYLDRVDDLRSKVRGAMIYPLVLTFVGVAAMLFVLIALVPKFRTVFGDATGLPAPTRMLFALSDLLVNQWVVMLGLIVLTAIGVTALLRSNVGAKWWARWQIKVPLVGNLIRTVAITRFCRILGTLLNNGVQILQALTISKDAAGSVLLAESIAEATEHVRAGEKLAEPLASSGLFPPEVIEMIAVAEESNQMEKVLLQIADTIERRTNRSVDTVVRLIEPLILVVIAGAIGFVALGLLYPIFTMSQSLK